MMGYGYDMSGWDWVWMVAMMGVAVIAVGAVVWAALALARRDGGGLEASSTPAEELDRRLARGEIDPDEYERRRDAMRPAASKGA